MSASDPPPLIHPTYRHLERPVRLAGLTFMQWALLLGAAVAAWLLNGALPFGATYNLSVAITLAGLPATAALAVDGYGITPWAYARSLWRWHTTAARHDPLSRPRQPPLGYRFTEPERPASQPAVPNIDALWD